MKRLLSWSILLSLYLTVSYADDRPEILIADFEGETYGDWKTEGEAFGAGPAKGTLPNQMSVTGFKGKGLVNSYRNGDGTTGKLTSPEMKVERKYIQFLIGGGKHPGKTCINLLVDGKVLHTATGPNDKSGGSEELDWHQWDVSDLNGKKIILEIVDQATGGWGHINIDHIIQTDKKLPGYALRPRMNFVAEKRYLNFPVKTGAPMRRVSILIDEKVQREFDIELADHEPEFWTFLDLSPFQKQEFVVEVDRLKEDSKALALIQESDTIKGSPLYQEKLRPAFHFTSRRGWLNDPNGLVFFKDEYHLFYQHNPYGWNWGNMHWGHAVSKDLFHWQELPIGIYPQKHGDWAFSGSAIVDQENSSGFGNKEEPPLVAAYTSTGRGECIVYSNDRGRTWKEYEKNPVVRHQGRDPKLLWHSDSKQWVMAVYDESEGKQWIAFYTSPDLKKWTFQSKIVGYFECPDLIQMSVDGDAKKQKWVLYAADGKYTLGDFDGKTFKPETKKLQLWHGNFYAAQTFSNAPDGRIIQIGWGQGITFPKMPFNQQMVIPVELTLRTTSDGIRMFAQPVKELESLRLAKETLKYGTLKEEEGINQYLSSRNCPEVFDLVSEWKMGTSKTLGINVRGTKIEYNSEKKELSCKDRKVPLDMKDGTIKLRVLVDRGSMEIFGNDGRIALSVSSFLDEKNKKIDFYVRGGEAKIQSLALWPLKSIWEDPKK